MAKKNAYVSTIGFNKNDPDHVQVAEFLNCMSRGKAQYIVNAVMAYQRLQERGEFPNSEEVLDYGKIKRFVLQVIAEHENSGVGIVESTSPSVLYAPEKVEGIAGLDEDVLNGIMFSLDAFRSE